MKRDNETGHKDFREAAREFGHWAKGVVGYAVAGTAAGVATGIAANYIFLMNRGSAAEVAAYAAAVGLTCGAGRMFGKQTGVKTAGVVGGVIAGAYMGFCGPFALVLAPYMAVAGWCSASHILEKTTPPRRPPSKQVDAKKKLYLVR